MAIRNLKPISISVFQGKNTTQNMTDAVEGTLLSAKNIMVLGDNQPRRAPGYTLVAALGLGAVHAIYDFQRSVDQAQFVLAHVGSSIIAMNVDGSNVRTLSTGETAAPFQFVSNAFVCYGSNGVNAWRFVDVAGALTKYKWGIAGPTTAPAIGLSAGTLSLTYGRQYVYCNVCKYTDSLGIQRVSVGPPSPLSAHTGPTANQVVTLSTLQLSSDPQVNYKWIFATSDSPLNTSATYYFAAEIPNSQTSWGDTLLDAALDTTRLAPYDNNPAPPAPILTTFQNRVVAINGSLMQLSGYSEITLGIPEESWPISTFFNIPSGSRRATAAISLNQGTTLVVCTQAFWYGYTGYDASTFTEQDRIASPGSVGAVSLCSTPFGIVWLSESKRLWIWKGSGDATEISADVAQSLYGTYGMEDLSLDSLATARLHYFSYGQRHFVALFCRTSDAPNGGLNLLQLWNISSKGSQSSGQYTGSSGFYEQIAGLYQTDKIPQVSFTASGDVKTESSPYIYTGDAAGNIYRFPDGFTDNGGEVESSFSTPWMLCGLEGKKRFYWIDLYFQTSTATNDAGGGLSNFKIYASVADAPASEDFIRTELTLSPVPSPVGISAYAVRGNLQVAGLNIGRYLRVWIKLPSISDEDEVLLKMIVWASPVTQGYR